MYKLFKCSVVTDRYNFGFDIVDESSTKAESKSFTMNQTYPQNIAVYFD
ncbi:hypothetical protein [Staphylococcus cohnii]|nr:hypothetical protein [Staphylococcus saprophyticus]